MKKTTKDTTLMTVANQTEFPEFLQDSPTVQEAQAEILDMTDLSNRLEIATSYIRKEVGAVAKSFCKIGFKLWEVRENKLYLGQGFKNISEYGEKVLGFQKSSTANYIAVCERFSVQKNGKPSAQLIGDFANFSYTQLSLMLSMPEEKLTEITPDTSCKEIRDIKKGVSASDSDDGDESETVVVTRKVSPPISVFERVLTEDNLPLVIKLLKENIGREISIYVETDSKID